MLFFMLKYIFLNVFLSLFDFEGYSGTFGKHGAYLCHVGGKIVLLDQLINIMIDNLTFCISFLSEKNLAIP